MLFALGSHATAVLLLVLLQSPASPITKMAEKAAPLCSVSGRVVSAADGSPLKSARLALMPEHRDESQDAQVYAATSDSDGRFTIKSVPAGRYQFFASHNGYVDQRYQSKESHTGAILALQAGQQIEDVLFRMVLAAVITGRINDEDGEPMPNIQVVVLRRPSDDDAEDSPWWTRKRELTPVGSGQTDDRGLFRIFGLEPGEYYVRAVDEFIPPMIDEGQGDKWAVRESLGSQYAPVYYPGVTQIGQAQAVPVTPGEEAQVDFVMRRTKMIEISGRVISPDGKACSDCYVVLNEVQGSGFSVGHMTAKDGTFKIRGVAPGTYILQAGQNTSFDLESYHVSQKIEAGSDNIDSLTLALGRGMKLAGHIVSAGTARVNLERIYVFPASSDSDGQPGGWSKVDKNGAFSFNDVPDGSFSLEVNNLDADWYVKSARLGAQDIFNEGLQIERGQPAGSLEVIINNGGAQLDGAVTEDSKPQSGIRVRLSPEPETPYNRRRIRKASTDQSGRFTFAGIAPGRYRLTAKGPSAEGATPAASEPKDVNLAEREHKTVDLVIVPPPAQ